MDGVRQTSEEGVASELPAGSLLISRTMGLQITPCHVVGMRRSVMNKQELHQYIGQGKDGQHTGMSVVARREEFKESNSQSYMHMYMYV